MIVYINERNEIRDVGTNSIGDPTLREFELPDEEFGNFSKAKLCCYKIYIVDGQYMGFSPYVDSRLISHIDQLGYQNEKAQADVEYVAMMTDVELPE